MSDIVLSTGNSLSPDLISALLADKQSASTRRVYGLCLKDFFLFISGQEPTPALVAQFLSLSRPEALALVLSYKAALLNKGLKEATINQRLAAIKSLVNYAGELGKCQWNLDSQTLKSLKVQKYRDTSGVSAEEFKTMLATCDRSTLKGKRDYAILRILWENCLRRNELANTKIANLDIERGKLWICGKGQGNGKESISLSKQSIAAVLDYLTTRGVTKSSEPLWIAVDKSAFGHQLSTTAIYKIVRAAAEAAGITRTISPHRLRHAGITEALERTNGDIRTVQKLSRHKKIETLMIYDDNRRNEQGALSEMLSQLI